MNEETKKELLQTLTQLAPGYATSEHESTDEAVFLKNFLPLADYKKIFEPDIFLIVGGRGTGKTELFRLLSLETGRETLFKQTKSRAFTTLNQTHWLAGFGHNKMNSKRFPANDVIEQQMIGKNDTEWRAFWVGLLVGSVLTNGTTKDFTSTINPELLNLLTKSLPQLSKWLPLAVEHYEELSSFLDQLDNELIDKNQWHFFLYDELDRVVSSYEHLSAPIRVLLSFWLNSWQRWERIRPKIFLRHDLFREDFLGFTDASKLRPHHIRLEWNKIQLYQLLSKRLLNSSTEWQQYLGQIEAFTSVRDDNAGLIPASTKQEPYENIMIAMIGEYMGADPRKGNTFNWIPNHLQDADGRIAPRSFLKLFVIAAENRLEKNDFLTDTKLLQPSDLQAALQETSTDRIKELTQEEYPWINALMDQLVDLEAPLDKKVFLSAIKKTTWSEQNKPPSRNAEQILNHLSKLGVIETRTDGKINIPEIYLYGFKMKRRGGVRRSK